MFKQINIPLKYKWSEIPSEIKNNILLKFIISFSFVILGVVSCFYMKNMKYSLVVVFVVFTSFIYDFYELYLFLSGKVTIIEGNCIISESSTKKIFKETIYGKSYIYIEYGKSTLRIPSPHNIYDENDKIRVYTQKTDIFKIGDDIYAINNPLFMKKIKKTKKIHS